MKRTRFSLISAFLLVCLLAGACTSTSSSPTPSVPVSAPPIVTPQRAPTIAPQQTQPTVDRSKPAAVLALDHQTGDWVLCEPNAKPRVLFSSPGISPASPHDLHIASPLPDEAEEALVITRTWQPQQALVSVRDSETVILRPTSSFAGLAGAPGLPLVAFSEVIFEENGAVSRMVAGHVDALGSAESALEMTLDQNSLALKPLSVEASGSEVSGIWFTQQGWNLFGTDMVFPLSRGLYYLDEASGITRQLLDDSRNLQGFSSTHNLAGSVQADIDGDKSMHIHHLSSQRTIQFELLPDSKLGAGIAVFSPDGQSAAWLEASGSLSAEPSTFNAVLRTGDVGSAEILREISMQQAAHAAGWQSAGWMQPAGWLDNQTLLIQVHSSDWQQVSLVQLDMSRGSITQFFPGSFLGFFYP